MLFWIAKLLSTHYTAFHVFSYLTLRAILAVMSALAMSLLIGPAMIESLSRYQIGQVVRDDGPRTHLPKAGHPPWVAR
jgi:phospho-N-acetylmuramoyl-pentapeptide-transferase